MIQQQQTTLEQLRTPYNWVDEIPLNKSRLEECRLLALESSAAFTVFLPERTAQRIGELATLDIMRTNSSRKVEIDGLETTSRLHLAFAGGGVPYASALGFEVHRQNPKTPYRQGYTKMTRYGNLQSGSEKLQVQQPPLAEDIDGMDVVFIDDLVDRGHTIRLAAKLLLVEGIPYSEISTFLNNAYQEGIMSMAQFNSLVSFYTNFGEKPFNTKTAKPASLAGSVLVDKQFDVNFEDYLEYLDVGLYGPKVWLQRMGMDGKNEAGRWGEGVVASGAQDVKYASEMSDALDLVGDLAIKTMDGPNGILWLDDKGYPTSLPKTYL